jgi:hypothetical protein
MNGDKKINFLQSESFTINTTLSPGEVRRKLLDATSLNSTQYRADKMFRGEIKNSTFEIYRMFKGYNSFAALAKGEIHQDPNSSGSIIKITMDPSSSVRIVVNFISGVGVFIYSFSLLSGIFTGDLSIILRTLGGGAFFYLFFTQGFKAGRARIKTELQELLQ